MIAASPLPECDIGVEIDVWENEGGSIARDDMNHDYGLRVEADRSWTIHHVFTGVPAHVGGRKLTGLDQGDATAVMMFLNARNAERRRVLPGGGAFSPSHND